MSGTQAFQFEATVKASGYTLNENDLSRTTKVTLKTGEDIGAYMDLIAPLSTVRVTIEFEPKEDDNGQDEQEEGE